MSRSCPSSLSLSALPYACGAVRLPGSKSLSNRLFLLSALACGTTSLVDALDSDDTRVMVDALRTLGIALAAETSTSGRTIWRVEGCGGVFPVKQADLFLGNAGTAVRSLTAALALSGGHYRIRGVERMHERPIGDLVDGLRQIGAIIHYAGRSGFPPLDIAPATVDCTQPIRLRSDVSSQYLSALLLALPLSGAAATIEMTTELISKPYVEITLNLLARFGVQVEREGWRSLHIPGGQHYRSPGEMIVEGDASSASYFLAAGAIAGGPVQVDGVGRNSIQGDIRFADALEAAGAQVHWGEEHIAVSSPSGQRLRAFDQDCNAIPDAAMTLAVLALFADGPCTLRNIASWRVKETDRLTAMATELRKLGALVDEDPDQLTVHPPARLTPGAIIDTYDDHRMAMCFALAALGPHGVPVTIRDPGCVDKTFPAFFDAFEQISAPVIAIDGPSASGKGTVAQKVAQALGFHYLDSGALYRLTAWAAQRAGLRLDSPDALDAEALAQVAAQLSAEFSGERIFLAGEEVSSALREEAIGMAASRIAALPAVRAALLARQRHFRRWPGLVADGRDMGSVVFAGAQVKVFLTASVEARAQRRFKQLIDKGLHANIDTLLLDLQARDDQDRSRRVAPLRPAEKSHELDSSMMSIQEVVAAVLALVRQALPLCVRDPGEVLGRVALR
jgi:3-phosphoshikimate 1-carboxyvinyltransferase